MEIQVSTGDLLDQTGDTYVVTVPAGSRPLAGDTAAADRRLGGAIERARSQGLLTGSAGHVLEFPGKSVV